MRMLLLGANGQLGSDIVSANSKLVKPFEIESATRAQLDVAKPESIKTFLSNRSFDVLVNCTGFHKTDEVEAQGTTAVAINANAPKLLAEACAAAKARLVHISTDYVFGGYHSTAPLREVDAPAPVNVYGATKLLGENLAFAKHKDVMVLRVASLFGAAGASGKGGNFVETMIRLGKERGELRVVSDQIMSPTATADVAQWILALLERRAQAGLYHAVNSGPASWFEFACAINEMSGTGAKVSPIATPEFPTVAMRPAYSALDNSKLASMIGPIRRWEHALESYLITRGHIR